MSNKFLIADRVRVLHKHLVTVLDTNILDFADHAADEAGRAHNLDQTRAPTTQDKLHTITGLLRIAVHRLESLREELGVPVEAEPEVDRQSKAWTIQPNSAVGLQCLPAKDQAPDSDGDGDGDGDGDDSDFRTYDRQRNLSAASVYKGARSGLVMSDDLVGVVPDAELKAAWEAKR